LYAADIGLEIPSRTDQLFPLIAFEHLPSSIGIVFIVGLIAAAYSTADSALTSLTTSFCVDFLDIQNRQDWNDKEKIRNRYKAHIGFSIVLFIIILLFHALNSDAVINGLFKAAGYTYGPILGLFAFALIFGRSSLNGKIVIATCILAPVLTYWLDVNNMYCGFSLGFLNLLLNGVLSFVGLLIALKTRS
jgi:Na+/pantothenate symporter